jgi:hypothetical protein
MLRYLAVENLAPLLLDDKEAIQTRNVTVGNVKKSIAAITSRWFCKKASHFLSGSPQRTIRRKYRATLRSAMAKPSFCSSAWIFGSAPIGILVSQTAD